MFDGLAVLAALFSVGFGFLTVDDALSNAIGAPRVVRPVDHIFDRVLWSSLMLTWAGLAAAVGGLLWHVRRRQVGRPLYGGSVAQEPHGRDAVEWGLLTFAPVCLGFVLFALVFYSSSVAEPSGLALGFWLGASVGARLYYGGHEPPGHRGLRRWIERPRKSHIRSELQTSVAWSVLIGTSGVAGAVLARWLVGLPLASPWYVAFAVLLPVVLAAATVYVAVATNFPGPMADAMRAPLAAVALRSACCLSLVLVWLPP